MRHTWGDPGSSRGEERAPVLTCVRDRMSRPVVTIAAHAALAEALRVMTEHRIHYLPVVDDHAILVGIVNIDDIQGTRSSRPVPDETVAAVMSTPVVSVSPAVPLTEALHLMAGRSIGALPVVEGGCVVGILTQSDVVTALARHI